MAVGKLTELEKLQQAIALLESQQATLGDEVVKLALAPLKEKIAALSAQPESQRRIITVLFADVQNFTALSEKMDMEDVRDAMSSDLGTSGWIDHRPRGIHRQTYGATA